MASRSKTPPSGQPVDGEIARGIAAIRRDMGRGVVLAERYVQSKPPERPSRFRGIRDAIAGLGLVLALIGIFQGARSLDGLRDSLQREELTAVFTFTLTTCEDPEGAVAGWTAKTILTNTGRLPITVVHVRIGPSSSWVNDWAFVRLDDEALTVHRTAVHLEPGEAISVFSNAKGRGIVLEVEAVLSNGETVVARRLPTAELTEWPVLAEVNSLDPVACPAGTTRSP